MRICSEVARDRTELVHDRAVRTITDAFDSVEAMVEVVVDQGALGLFYRSLDGMELLGDVNARPSRFDHLDDGLQMAVSALEPLCDRGM